MISEENLNAGFESAKQEIPELTDRFKKEVEDQDYESAYTTWQEVNLNITSLLLFNEFLNQSE